jgi:2-C-methyl-D-erythritol 4-phosphate cytidylyltransferase
MTAGESVTAIIVAAGEGKRLGQTMPKAFVPLGGRPMFTYSLAVFDAHPCIDTTVIVVAESMMAMMLSHIGAQGLKKPVHVAAGGQHRWQSVHSGVLAAGGEWVLVHDAARPFVDSAAIDALLEKRATYRCAIIGTPAVDTMRTFEGDRCTGTIDRNILVRVGTPQLFHRQTLLDAFGKAHNAANPPTDEAVLMETCGIAVGLAWGNPLNFKITTRQDLEIAEAIVAARRSTTPHP